MSVVSRGPDLRSLHVDDGRRHRSPQVVEHA
jgi:hypothetical protein